VFNGTAWQTAATAVDDTGTANTNSVTAVAPSVAIDANNNAMVLWLQKQTSTGSDTLYFSRYTASSGLCPRRTTRTLKNSTPTGAVNFGAIALDGSGNGIAVWRQTGSIFAKKYTQSTNTWAPSPR